MTLAPGTWPDTVPAPGSLRAHLVASGLAGEVATTPRQTLANCRKAVDGDPDYTFGLSGVAGAPTGKLVDAVREVCGGDPAGQDPEGPGWIDPDACLAGIEAHRRALAAVAERQGRVLLATGHPTGLLAHGATLVRALQDAGCEVVTPLDDAFLDVPEAPRRVGIRYTEGVACEFDGASLRHTHRPRLMEAMLDDLGSAASTIGLVVADHGLAGAAIERGLPTISIADVNDPALPLAQARGLTDGVLPIDDNLAPRAFLPVTQAMLDW